MNRKIYKVHTDTFGRLAACIQKSMYGVSNTAFTKQLPADFHDARPGDMVFISEKEISNNALFGPFYIVQERIGVVCRNRKGVWVNIDANKTSSEYIAYWVELEKRNWCLLFDNNLSGRISIVWPYNWRTLNLNLPSWGLVRGDEAHRLLDFAINNEVEAKEFLSRHNIL